MLNAYYSEKDSLNLQMILGGFITLLEDTSIYELEQTFKLNEVAKVPKSESSLTNQTKDKTLPGTVFQTTRFRFFSIHIVLIRCSLSLSLSRRFEELVYGCAELGLSPVDEPEEE